ncbi:unnamed protein product [Candidula unifasciata]|uniref:Glycerate kinase n=1 Tax=Candidula unifasciata TaxID=100452 RepID=A0A8S3YVC1_9EUPU|nr:unnamed protein product [Candidula unifasciata]
MKSYIFVLIKVMSLFRYNVILTSKKQIKRSCGSRKLMPQQLFCLRVQYEQGVSKNNSNIKEQRSDKLDSVAKDLLPAKSIHHSVNKFLNAKVHHQRSISKYSLTGQQLKKEYFHLGKNNYQITPVNRCLISGNLYGISRKLLRIKENLSHPLVVQYSTTVNQWSAAGNQPTVDNSRSNMADTEHPATGFHHVKCPSTAHGGPAVSDDDVQLMNDARKIFDEAVESVLPHHLVRNKLKLSQSGTVLKVDEAEYRLQKNVYVIGFGKAVIGMARAVDDSIGEHIVKGVISVPVGIQQMFNEEGKQDMLVKPDSRIKVMEGAPGNLPDEAAHEAAREIIKIAEAVKEDDILIVLISGGGSALLPSPKPPVTLKDMLSLTRLMSRSGANIVQMNTVRKEIEILKGGGLAKLAQPAKIISLILSDIIGDPLDFIACGPTVKNACTLEDSTRVLDELNIWSSIPQSVNKLLKEEHNKRLEGDRENVNWSLVQNVLVGSNKSACEAACARSSSLGYLPYLLSTQVEGEAQDVGRMYISLAKYISLGLKESVQKEELSDLEKKLVNTFKITTEKLREMQVLAQQAVTSGKKGVCIVAGGETTVIVKGKGIGGRNQEMAVAAALQLENQFPNLGKVHGSSQLPVPTNVVFLAAGTDGIDGPNPAAGGVISVGFKADAAVAGLDVVDFLSRNDTYTLLSQVDQGLNHVITGHTGTNVMDIHILLITTS